MALTMHVGLATSLKGLSMYLATVQTIVIDRVDGMTVAVRTIFFQFWLLL